MKSFLLYVFNLIRNTALIIVLSFAAYVAYLAFVPGAYEEFYATAHADCDPGSVMDDDVYGIQSEEEAIGVFSEDHSSVAPPAVNPVSPRRIKLKTRGGYAYVRPEEVLFVQTGRAYNPEGNTPRNCVLTLITGDEIVLNREETISKLEKRFDPFEQKFFSTNSLIVNCDRLVELYTDSEQRAKNNYRQQYVAKLSDGSLLDIPERKFPVLQTLLDELHGIEE